MLQIEKKDEMMERKIWIMVKAVLFDKRVVLPGFLLLAIVFMDFLFLNRNFSGA